jgi:RNA polymerase sigma-70 factor (ECF subfamily)
VVQSVFIKLIENIDKIDRIECNKTKAFIVIITRNLSINLYRKRNSHKNMVLENIEDVICDTSQPIDERIISEEILDRISHNR